LVDLTLIKTKALVQVIDVSIQYLFKMCQVSEHIGHTCVLNTIIKTSRP